jgi:cytoskeletal protein RodZ
VTDQISEGRARGAAGASSGTLGEQLRAARQQRGISLREISDQTRIAMRYLEAIEANDYKQLPGGIFNRSFIKAYARIVRFDEETALAAYASTAREYGETPDEVATSPTRSRIYMDGETTRSPYVTGLLTVVILGVLILLVFGGLHWYRRTENSVADATATAPSSSTAANNPSAPPAQAPTNAVAPQASGLQVQVKAKGEEVWLDARIDDEKIPDSTLKADETKEFKPQNRLSLRYSKSKLNVMEVTINGQVAQAPPPNPKNGLVEWLITKDDYKQFLP